MSLSPRIFRFALYGLAVAVLVLSMYAIAKPKETGGIPQISAQDHIKGAQTATVTLIEYSDFQCPACKNFLPLTEEILATYGDRITFSYRHFPLTTIHKNAYSAALAAEAAANQGKFWEMHDMLFDRQTDWAETVDVMPLFSAYAELIGLDVTTWKADIESEVVKDHVDVDIKSGKAAGISGTPTLFLNGTAITFPKNTNALEYLSAQIDVALTAQATP